MKKRFHSFLAYLLTLCMLMGVSVPAWAVSGNGKPSTPYVVDSETVSAVCKGDGTYRLSGDGASYSNSYVTGTTSEAPILYHSIDVAADKLYVGDDEYVALSANLPTEIRGGGTLLYEGCENGNPIIEGKKPNGASSALNTLIVTDNEVNGVKPTARVKGAFGTVTGKVQPVGDVTLGAGSYTVNGSGTAYAVTIKGNALVSGIFSSLTINDGASVTITADTNVTGSITKTTYGTLTVQPGVTLCVNGTSVKPEEQNVTIKTWGRLPTGTYASVSDEWTLDGDVTVNGTTCGIGTGANHAAHDELSATLNNHTLTVTDGTVKALGSGTVVGGVGGKATLRVFEEGVKAYGTFESISITEGTMTVPEGETISAYYKAVNESKPTFYSVKVRQNTVFTSFNGVLPTRIGAPYQFANLIGDWKQNEAATSEGEDFDNAELVIGDNSNLTINRDNVTIKGTFKTLNTDSHVVKLVGDTVIGGGTFKVRGANDADAEAAELPTIDDLPCYNLTVNGGSGEVSGRLKRLTVTGGTVVDRESGSSCKLSFNNTTTELTGTAISVTGGTLTLSNQPDVKANGNETVPAVSVTGGTLTLKNGNVEAWGDKVKAIYVGDGGKVILGNQAQYNRSPGIITHGNGSTCLYVNNQGEATVYRGDLSFKGSGSYGISVNNNGVAYIYPNDAYGEANATMASAQIYIHGDMDTLAAAWVNEGGKIEIRGRGALLEQPALDRSNESYALFIANNASTDSVLAGGTFNGKVYYQLRQLASLFPANHYLRYDGTAANYGASDGSRGVVPDTNVTGAAIGSYANNNANASVSNGYTDTFGELGEYYSIVDAEWELRYQMTVANSSYQIPAGLLDVDVSGAVTNTLTLDKNDPAKWGIGKRQGDLNVSKTGATLYLAGRTLTYDGASLAGVEEDDKTLLTDANQDNLHTVALTGGSLTVIDAVLNGNGCIGTGEITYTGTPVGTPETAAVHVCGGTLNVVSGKLSNPNANGSASGVYVHGSGTAYFGTTPYDVAKENTDNQYITVSGRTQGVKVDAGGTAVNVYVYGGTVKGSGETNETYGVNVFKGKLIVKGGVLSGNNANQGYGVYTTGGTTTITGGALYGTYAADNSNGTSLCVNGGTVNLQIDEAHKGYTAEETKETSGKQHINNIYVASGELNIGELNAASYSRNNGELTCAGGKTTVFEGVTIGDTYVYGAQASNTGTNFGTKFFVEDGDFGSLTVENYDSSITYTGNLNDYVQLHGGYYQSIENNATTGDSAFGVQSLIGVWATKKHDGSSNSLARYNHYAELVNSSRGADGRWTRVTAIQSGTAKTDSVPLIDYENGKAVSIRSAVDEFKTWATGGTPSTFKLYANLWMGDSVRCSTDYCNAAHAPVTFNVAGRTLDLNGFGIYGDMASSALLTVNGTGNLTVMTGKPNALEAYANRIRNFGSGAAVNAAAGGTLTLDGAQISSNSGSAITTAGTTTITGGTITGATCGVDVTGGSLTVTDGTITGATYGVDVTGGSLTVTDGTVNGNSAGIDFDGNGNLSISGGAIQRLDVGTGTGAISLTGNATYGSVTTARDSVYSSLLGNGYDWQKTVGNSNPAPMPRTTANYGAIGNLIQTLPTAANTVYSVKPVTHRLTINETSASMTTANAEKQLTVECFVGNDKLANAFVSAESSAAGVASVSGTYSAYTVTKKDADANAATITFTSAYGDKVTFRVNPAPVITGGGAAAPATTVSVSGDENSVSISATVSGNTATMSEPSEKELEKVIGASVETGEVTIDMSGLSSTVTTAAVPAATIKAISAAVSSTANDADELTIKLPGGSATFDAAAVAAVTEQMKGTALDLTIAKTAESKLTAAQRSALKTVEAQEIYSVTLVSGNTTISDFKGGSATVTVPYTLKSDQDSRGIVVWHVASDGLLTEVPAAYANGMVTFTTTHFSDYVIAYDAERAKACLKDETCPMAAFSDLDLSEWYHDGIHWSLENGVMNGVGDGLFRPMDTTTRAMVATMLWRMEGSPVANYAMDYTDVEPEAWYTEAIRWASAEGIVTGYGDGIFGVNDSVTREQLATMLYRYAQYKKLDVSVGEDTNILSYEDALSVSEWAISAMQWAVGAGIINGMDGSLAPVDHATRAQVATMLMRYGTNAAK